MQNPDVKGNEPQRQSQTGSLLGSRHTESQSRSIRTTDNSRAEWIFLVLATMAKVIKTFIYKKKKADLMSIKFRQIMMALIAAVFFPILIITAIIGMCIECFHKNTVEQETNTNVEEGQEFEKQTHAHGAIKEIPEKDMYVDPDIKETYLQENESKLQELYKQNQTDHELQLPVKETAEMVRVILNILCLVLPFLSWQTLL